MIDWNDGSVPERIPLTAGTYRFSATHQYLDDDPTGTAADDVSIRVRVQDDTLDVLAARPASDTLSRYDGTTVADLGVLVSAGSGGLANPSAVAVGPDGDLYVSSGAAGTNPVLRFSGVTGAFIETFIPAGSQGTTQATDLTFGPDGQLYYLDGPGNRVLRFDGMTGAYLDEFIPAGSGGLSDPRGLAFGPDGHLYLASLATDSILRYDGQTGGRGDRRVPVRHRRHRQPAGYRVWRRQRFVHSEPGPRRRSCVSTAPRPSPWERWPSHRSAAPTDTCCTVSDGAVFVADPGGPLRRYAVRQGTLAGEANTADGRALAGLPLQAEASALLTVHNTPPLLTVTAAPNATAGQ